MAETLRIEIPVETVDNTDPELSNITKNFEKMEKAADNANASAKKAGNTVSQFDKQAEKTEKSLARWAKEKYGILLEAKDRISPILSTIGSGLKSFAGKTWNVTMKAIDLVTAPVRGIINLLKNPVFQIGSVMGVSIGLKDTVDTYSDFEATMSRVKSLSSATDSQMVRLTQTAKKMGAETKYSGTESAEAFTYMAQAGWEVDDMIDGIGGIMSLAASDGIELASATDIVANALTSFNMTAKDTAQFADVLAVASSATNTNVSELGEAFKYIAPTAGALGYSIEDVSLALGLMSNNAVKGSMAGTSLKTSLANLAAPTEKMSAAMEKYGISMTDSSGNMKSLKELLDNLRSSLGGLSEQEQTAAASVIFGKEAMSGMLGIINSSQEGYAKLTEQINNASGAAGSMAETMQDNLAGAFEEMGGAVETVQLTLGERMKPYLLSLSGWIKDNMPAIEEMANELFDSVDRKAERMRRRFQEISGTMEWQDADFLGKVKISWDEFIAEPFKEWWGSTGKAKFADFAQDIGEGIGTGLKVGVMTMLGIDISETIDEGVSIGASFAKGFSDGFDFDQVSEKILDGIGNLFSNAAKLLPGGESADLSSIFSAAMLMKMGSPLLSIGKGAFSIGKGLFGTGSAGGTSILGSIIGSTGNAAMQGTGLLNVLANAGYSLTGGPVTAGGYFGAGTAMSGTSAALAGGAGITGGIAAGTTLLSAAGDLHRAVKSDDREESKAYGTSAGLKAGGVAAGAAIGTIIFPGVGTLVGAGIGGIAGWIAGDKVTDNYEEDVEQMEAVRDKITAVYEATGTTISETAEFADESLKNALEDSSVGAEEFAQRFRESCAVVARDAFGDVTLSLEEVKKIAENITFGNMKEGLDEFNTAADAVDNSLSSLKSSVSAMKKENWKVSLGLELSETERDSYKSAIDLFVENARKYISDSHYEAQVSMKLFLGDSADMTGIDNIYNSYMSQVETLSARLGENMSVALEDGIITLNESEEIMNLQQQITDITQKLADAQNKAELDAIGIEFGQSGAGLTAESFSALQEQLASYKEDASESYGQSMRVALSNVELQLAEGAVTEEQASALKQQIEEEYSARMGQTASDMMSFNMQTLSDAFAGKLDGILPEVEGTVAEKLQEGMKRALTLNPDVEEWAAATEKVTGQDLIRYAFDLDSLSEEDYSVLKDYIIAAAGTLPQAYIDSLKTQMLSGEGSGIPDALGDPGLIQGVKEAGAAVAVSVSDGVTEEMKNQTGIIGSSIRSEIQNGIDYGTLRVFTADAKVRVKVRTEYEQENETAIPTLGNGASSGTGLHTAALELAKKAGRNATGIGRKANGGYVSGGPQLSWLAEEGYGEFVIPTNPARRARALDLYEQAGAALGVSAHAAGGYVEGSKLSDTAADYNLFTAADRNAPMSCNGTTDGKETDKTTSVYEPATGGGKESTPVQVSVQVSPQFSITAGNGQDEETIIRVIRKNMKTLADEMGGAMADKLEEVFSNMPLKEA